MTQLSSTLTPKDRAEFTSNLRRHIPTMLRLARKITGTLEAAHAEMERGEEFSRPTLRRMYRSSNLLDGLYGDDNEGTSRRVDLSIYSALLLGQLVVGRNGWVTPSEADAELALEAETPTECEAPTMDALAEATRIARSTALVDVDWSREPLTERERRVRARWIERQLETALGRIALRCRLTALRLRALNGIGAVGSDIAAADAQAHVLDRAEGVLDERAEFEDIADELDEEDADDADYAETTE